MSIRGIGNKTPLGIDMLVSHCRRSKESRLKLDEGYNNDQLPAIELAGILKAQEAGYVRALNNGRTSENAKSIERWERWYRSFWSVVSYSIIMLGGCRDGDAGIQKLNPIA
jgi:hypothetical protein